MKKRRRDKETERRSERGFFVADAVLGLALVGVLIVMLMVMNGQYRRAMQSFADQRAAVRAAEQTLVELQTGVELGHADAVIRAVDSRAMAGHSWVAVEVTIGRRTAALIGLVPQEDAEVQP